MQPPIRIALGIAVFGLAGCSTLKPADPGAIPNAPTPALAPVAPASLAVADLSAAPPKLNQKELPPVNLEPGMTYEQLKSLLGKPDSVDRERVRNGVWVSWGPLPVSPGSDPQFQVDAVFRGHNIQRRVPVGINVQEPFPGTLHGFSLGGTPAAAGLKEGGWGIGPGLSYSLEHSEKNGVVHGLTAWKEGLMVLPVGAHF
jgi:hypothetical protein